LGGIPETGHEGVAGGIEVAEPIPAKPVGEIHIEIALLHVVANF